MLCSGVLVSEGGSAGECIGTQFNLDSMYHAGNKGVEKDAVKAVHWYRKASDQGYGYAYAQCHLGNVHNKGCTEAAIVNYRETARARA
jgi:TPR repeat protein